MPIHCIHAEEGLMTEQSQATADHYVATVARIDKLNPATVCVRLSCPEILHYKAGQYLKVYVDEQTARYYSLASAPAIDKELHLHVRQGEAGSVGRWFHEALEAGDRLRISAPQGRCRRPEQPDQPMAMIATGSGLAPFYGIARDALRHGHAAPIYLYHGVRDAADLYLTEQLRGLSCLYSNFHYVPCVSGTVVPSGCVAGRSLDIALCNTQITGDWHIYLSGNPAMIEDAWTAFRRMGVPHEGLISDYSPRAAAAVAALAA